MKAKTRVLPALVLVCTLPLFVGCASLSGGVADAGDAVGDTVTNVANDSAAVLGKVVELDFPGLIKATGDALANLIKGAAAVAAVPLSTLQNAAGEAVDTVTPDSE